MLEYFSRIREDYEPSADIWGAENERANEVKVAMKRALTEGERNTLILYAELGSLAEVARVLGVSKSTAGNQLTKIRAKIWAYMNR